MPDRSPGAQSTWTTVPPVNRTSSVEVCPEDRIRRSGGNPYLRVAAQVAVDDGFHGGRMANRSNAADFLASRLPHLVRRRPLDPLFAQPPGQRCGVHPVGTADVMTRRGSPSAIKTRLFPIAPTSQPRVCAASAAVRAEPSVTTSCAADPRSASACSTRAAAAAHSGFSMPATLAKANAAPSYVSSGLERPGPVSSG